MAKYNHQNSFDQFVQLADEGGVEAALDFLEHRFRCEKEFFKLFEVLKMRCRHRLGLPLVYRQQPDDLDETEQRKLEDGLLDACRDVGILLINDGRLQEGWMYLQPVGDRELSEKAVRSIQINDENIDTVVEIAVSQGAAPDYGFGLLMNHYGTCNAITTFDTQAGRFDKKTQQAMSSQLLRHFYNELCHNIHHVVEQNEKTVVDRSSLTAVLTEHPWLMEGGAHHIDTTHLASLMRIARIVESKDDLKKAAELADYGSHLHSDFQYSSSPPFEDTYLDHQLFYYSLLGENVEASISHFERKCESVDAAQHGPTAFETLVDLLVRLGRKEKAIGVLTQKVLGQFEPLGIAPSIFEIAETKHELGVVRDYFRQQEDLLGFAVSVLKEKKDA